MSLALDVKNLVKIYSPQKTALDSIDLQVSQGDFFALLGPNGAGKSTLIGIITSIVRKSSGSVKIFDVDIDKNFPEAKRLMGVVPQEYNFNLFEKVWQVLVYQAGYYGVTKKEALLHIDELLEKLGLYEQRNYQVRALSGGMKRRLMIARALVHKPSLLILDEPTAGVDVKLRFLIWDFLQKINEQGMTIILTTHYLEEAEKLCRNIAIIDEGKIIESTTMKNLLQKVDESALALELDVPLEKGFTIPEFQWESIGENVVRIRFKSKANLNQLFESLNKKNIQILGIKNEMNRLEELFVRLTTK